MQREHGVQLKHLRFIIERQSCLACNVNGGAGVAFSVPVSKILMEELQLVSPPVASLSDPCISLSIMGLTPHS